MERVNGFFEVRNFGFGLAKPGSSYPSEWVSGWYDPGNVRAKAVFGTWKSTDDPNHGATSACNVAANAQTWTNIGGFPRRAGIICSTACRAILMFMEWSMAARWLAGIMDIFHDLRDDQGKSA